MSRTPGVSLQLANSEGDCFLVQDRHWDELTALLRAGSSDWIELDSVWGDGRLLVRVSDIQIVFRVTESFCEERDASDAADRMLHGDG